MFIHKIFYIVLLKILNYSRQIMSSIFGCILNWNHINIPISCIYLVKLWCLMLVFILQFNNKSSYWPMFSLYKYINIININVIWFKCEFNLILSYQCQCVHPNIIFYFIIDSQIYANDISIIQNYIA